jgi:hypothetical protein
MVARAAPAARKRDTGLSRQQRQAAAGPDGQLFLPAQWLFMQ